MNFDYPEGATPLDPDEIQGLLPTHVVNRSQLNELEQQAADGAKALDNYKNLHEILGHCQGLIFW